MFANVHEPSYFIVRSDYPLPGRFGMLEPGLRRRYNFRPWHLCHRRAAVAVCFALDIYTKIGYIS